MKKGPDGIFMPTPRELSIGQIMADEVETARTSSYRRVRRIADQALQGSHVVIPSVEGSSDAGGLKPDRLGRAEDLSAMMIAQTLAEERAIGMALR